ncbi:ribosome small subunit-dependent GTPase A [Brumimicrobium aurantiacum]|uniref:Small ribosomal subunit biogenesis GTPase RsgA n=1 Tax=Brumimicrobium aurantiacum TaxID=1737063 RepID=A0A3E1EV20_9FLAO|nr:ribosome small subunit-dependent GTPase A [Brumimicrobium aurantiacum]RFC53416.1 ribosome small subunit-dependent GTPase A [Brumimicrobium aurantiacum]
MKKGKVIKSTGKWYIIELEDGKIINAGIRGKIRLKGIKSTNPVAAGDEVMITENEDGTGMISEILPRKNYIVRKSINLSKQTHILAANVDRAYLLVTLVAPETHLAFIDRFLVAAEAYRIPVTLLFNKMDVYMDEHLPIVENVMELYEEIGYPCEKISALNKTNIDFLRDEIKDKQVMIAGHSGTGKSTLINALDNQLNIKTAEISIHHLQGQHTTTFAEMHKLQTGGYIIDTPGIRAFGVIDLDKKVMSHYFPEMRALLNQCKYHNCQHINEPHCVIKDAVENGEIESTRYKTYLDLMNEDQSQTYR